MAIDYTTPPRLQVTILWRLALPNCTVATMTVVPTKTEVALVLHVNGELQSAEEHSDWKSAVVKANKVRRGLIADGARPIAS